jgi:hypothetical protein
MLRIGEIALYGVPVALVTIGMLFAVAVFYAFRARHWLWRFPAVAAAALSLMGFTGSFVGIPTVMTNQQLGFLPSWQYFSVLRLAVNTAGDAPPQWFVPSSTACSISGGDIGSEVPSADGGCFNAAPPVNGIDVREFGASTAASDNSNALQAWANQACKFKLSAPPTGAYDFKTAPISFPLCNGVTIQAGGMYGFTLTYNGTSTTPDLVVIGDPAYTTQISGWNVQGLNVNSVTHMTAGNGVHLADIVASIFDQSNAGGQYAAGASGGTSWLWNGKWCDFCFDIQDKNFEASSQNDAIRASGRTTQPMAGYYYSNAKISGSAIGVHMGGATGAVNPINSQIIANGTNVVVDHAIVAAGNFASQFDSATAIDTSSAGPGVLIDDNLFQKNQVMVFEGAWDCTNFTHGLYVKNINGQRVVANFAAVCGNKDDGIRIDDAYAYVSDNNATGIYNNGTSGTGYGINAIVANSTIFVDSIPPGNASGPWDANAVLGTVNCGGASNCYTKDFYGNIHQTGVINFSGAANTFLSVTWTYPVAFPNSVFLHSLKCSAYGWSNGNTAQMTVGAGSVPGNSSALIGLVSSHAVTAAQPVQCDIWGH